MITAMLLSLVVSFQGAPAARPAAPIAASPAGAGGPTMDVPAEYARLTGPNTVAVIFVPDATRLQSVVERVTGLGDVGRGMGPSPATLRQMVRQSVRTELEVPLDQPVLWWIDMRTPEGDEPPMGFDNLTMRQAFRIPGASAATEKARAEAAKADPKARVPMPVRARDRRASVSVLAGDLVVVSSDGEPVAAPADGAGSSALLERMPRGQVCGRVDLSRVLAENADQLRMMGGFLPMALGGGTPGPDASDDERREAAMRAAFAEGAGRQVTSAIEALMQLKRATFAVDLQGDEMHVWADWSRDLAFPAGLDEATVNSLAARLPAGLDAWFGASGSALDAMYGERFVIDDVIATLGGTPEQKQAWEAGAQRLRAAVAGIERGVVGGVTMQGAEPVVIAAFRVKDASTFRADLTAAASEMSKSGIAEVKLDSAGDRLDWVATPNMQRLRDMMSIAGGGEQADLALKQAAEPVRFAMSFKGPEVTLTYARGSASSETRAGQGVDLRDRLVQGGWGTADWFATADLRGLLHRTMSALTAADEQLKPSGLAQELDHALSQMKSGKPALVRMRQGVQGGTARLSIAMNLAEMKALVVDLEALTKLARTKAAAGGADDDDDDEEDEGRKP